MKFTEELQISIASSTEEVIKLTATGKGTTLVPTPALDKEMDFGDIFPTCVEKKTLTLRNEGRKPLALQWYYDRSKPKEGEEAGLRHRAPALVVQVAFWYHVPINIHARPSRLKGISL